ncbi:MAG: hypothetical protein ACREBD_12845 [Blastocatellia bacterium]
MNDRTSLRRLRPATAIALLAATAWAQNPSQIAAPRSDIPAAQPRGSSIPLIDLANEKQRQVIVDREPGQYLGHPTTVLLEDGKTIITVYPKGHGKGAIQMKRSADGGLTWSERLSTPKSWETSLETPTIHHVIDAQGKKRLIVFSGLYPIRMSVSENDGKTWSELKPLGDGVNHFGGIVAVGFVEPLKTGKGHYLAMFHDDGRFFRKDGKKSPAMTLTGVVVMPVSGFWFVFIPVAGLLFGRPSCGAAREDITR